MRKNGDINMKHQSLKMTKALLVFAMALSACTKKRDASFSETDGEQIFAISEFGALEVDKAPFSLKTSSKVLENDEISKLKAYAEKGLVEIDEAKVPDRLKFMFDGVEVTGQKDTEMPIYFTVDRKNVTAWKEVLGTKDLSALEKQYAKPKAQLILSLKLQKTRSASEREKIASEIKKITIEKANSTTAKYLVPIFKYEVSGRGVLQRVKNDLREDTSTLMLKETDWDQATHIRLSPRKDSLNPVGLDTSDKQQLDRTFSIDRINGQIMSAKNLNDNFKIKLALPDNTLIMTNVEDDGVNIFEITKKSLLTDSMKDLIKSGSMNAQVLECSAAIKSVIPEDMKADCVTIHRFVVPVQFVRVELPATDRFGSEGSVARLVQVPYTENVGLVVISEMTEPKRTSTEEVYNSSTIIKVSDIKDSEFFFRRTLADSPVSTTFMPGEAAGLLIVKFELQDQRLVVKRANSVIDFKSGANSNDREDLMSIPATYLRKELTDSRGTAYVNPKFVKTNKESAEYISLNWTDNQLPASYSPVSYYGGGQCIASTADQVVSKLDMRLNEGVLNFTFAYTVALAYREECLGIYNAVNDYNPGDSPVQPNARLEERVSFLKKDEAKFQNHSDKSFVPSTPFPAQNALGYGVWTLGQFNPTNEGGSYGREGQQTDVPVVQDFRNGRQLVYTVTNLPKDDDKKLQVYKETILEIVQAWNVAYHKAFAGIKGMERSGDYVVVQFEGENGVTGHLGDLDRNIIHFENKFNGNHGVLGISQVGINSRSGIVVADSLIVYAGNLSNYVEATRRNLKNSLTYQKEVDAIRKDADEQIAKKMAAQATAEESSNEAQTPAQAEVNAAAAQFKNALKLGAAKVEASIPKSKDMNIKLSNLEIAKNIIGKVALERKALGNIGAFKYASAQMESSWVEKTLRRAIEKTDSGTVDIEGIIAEEVLKSLGNKLSTIDQMNLKRKVSAMKIQEQIRNKFSKLPGCILNIENRQTLNKSYGSGDFYSALKRALYFDLGHEMGHSQGLTHNFIASFDKANWKYDSKGVALSNYSSIMDYIDPSDLHWSGIGNYDSHALRAAHTGLIELADFGPNKAATIAALEQKGAKVIDGKFLHVENIKSLIGGSWLNIGKNVLKNIIKPYKYCTDIHVGYEPTCQRFDSGGSAVEVVDNLIAEYNDHQISAYKAWDRLSFNWINKGNAIGGSMRTMMSIRQYFDEFMYTVITRDKSQAEIEDYINASVKAYLFLNGVIAAPDVTENVSPAFPFQLDVIGKQDQNGKIVPVIFERKDLYDRSFSQNRLASIGYEYDKILAMQLLTLKGFPSYKYASSNIEFSFLDFEKYFLGMGDPKNSIVIKNLESILSDELSPAIYSSETGITAVAGKNEVTPSLRAYAAISTVLGLEANALRDKDNFANLFKVGSSMKRAPDNRLALSQLGVDKKSGAKMMFWALDNADIANNLLMKAYQSGKYLEAEESFSKDMKELALNQIEIELAESLIGDTMTEQQKFKLELLKLKTEAIKSTLVKILTKSKLVSAEEIAQDPSLAIDKQVEMVQKIYSTLMKVSIMILKNPVVKDQLVQKMAPSLQQLAQELPIADIAQRIFSETASAYVEESKDKETLINMVVTINSLAASGNTEAKYGMQMKNIEFLSKLTAMVNPEYAR